MTPNKYNEREIHEGRLTAKHLLVIFDASHLSLESEVRTFQRMRGLLIDGKAGPKTRAAAEGHTSPPLFSGRVCQPLRGGCYWSGNLFVPGKHNGRDGFVGPKGDEGWPDSSDAEVVAVAAGEVVRISTIANGHWIAIDHGHGIESLSGHLMPPGLVRKGQRVKAGQTIGVLWGRIRPPHIHFEIKRGGERVEPADFLELVGAQPAS
jgi:hypothetical protein